ncbi:hypothetical protein GEMRC1_012843 [Eukaryota sp. GEM-RC1]
MKGIELSIDLFLVNIIVLPSFRPLSSSIIGSLLYTCQSTEFNGLVVARKGIFPSLLAILYRSGKTTSMLQKERQNVWFLFEKLLFSWGGLCTLLQDNIFKIFCQFLESGAIDTQIKLECIDFFKNLLKLDLISSLDGSFNIFKCLSYNLLYFLVEGGLIKSLQVASTTIPEISMNCRNFLHQVQQCFSSSFFLSGNKLLNYNNLELYDYFYCRPVCVSSFTSSDELASNNSVKMDFIKTFVDGQSVSSIDEIEDLVKQSNVLIAPKSASQWGWNAINDLLTHHKLTKSDPLYLISPNVLKFVDILTTFYTPLVGSFYKLSFPRPIRFI